jgi:hypothetical protein
VGVSYVDRKSVTYKCVALDELRFRRLGIHFMESSDYDEIPLCKILYFVRDTGLLAE